MNSFSATLHASGSSASELMTVSVDDRGKLLNPEFSGLSFTDFEISPRVGNSARHLLLPDGRSLETLDNDAVDELCRTHHPQAQGILHILERNFLLALVAAAFFVVGGGIFVVYGIPALSKPIANMIPVSLDQKLAEQALVQLDKTVFEPTELPEDRQQELQQLFELLKPESQHSYQLLFRNSEILGANAFALPDGTIIFTDQIISLAEDDQMLAAVMLHEIGHVEERHAMQSVVQQAGISAIVLMISGDVNSASSIVLLLPTVLLYASYSQEKEWSADTYALNAMESLNIDPIHFADMMTEISADHSSHNKDEEKSEDETDFENQDKNITPDEEGNRIMDYFSTHPPTEKRVERFKEASKKRVE